MHVDLRKNNYIIINFTPFLYISGIFIRKESLDSTADYRYKIIVDIKYRTKMHQAQNLK